LTYSMPLCPPKLNMYPPTCVHECESRGMSLDVSRLVQVSVSNNSLQNKNAKKKCVRRSSKWTSLKHLPPSDPPYTTMVWPTTLLVWYALPGGAVPFVAAFVQLILLASNVLQIKTGPIDAGTGVEDVEVVERLGPVASAKDVHLSVDVHRRVVASCRGLFAAHLWL